MKLNSIYKFVPLIATSLILRFVMVPFLESELPLLRIASLIAIFIIGAAYLLRSSAKIIEETTEVLSERTKLAGGFLQSLGTAFPDMILGVVAAVVSLGLRSTDYVRAINYAIIAAATTFGSNIYNILHAVWSLHRQNKANAARLPLQMFPGIKAGGMVTPFFSHQTKPHLAEMDMAIDVLRALNILTASVAVCMVLFGRVRIAGVSSGEDLYQLIQPIGLVIFVISGVILYRFRKTKRKESAIADVAREEAVYQKAGTATILLHLLMAGMVILFTAEGMVNAVEALTRIAGIPSVIAGALAGMIGSLGEMLVIHNYSVNPKGRIGDAVIGVGMDNIVTTAGAAVVAMMGGIFLGGSSLIIIFVLILMSNSFLIAEVAKLKNNVSRQN